MEIEFNYTLKDGRIVEVHASGKYLPGDNWVEYGYSPEPGEVRDLFCDVYYYVDPKSPDLVELYPHDLSDEWDKIEQEAANKIFEEYGVSRSQKEYA